MSSVTFINLYISILFIIFLPSCVLCLWHVGIAVKSKQSLLFYFYYFASVFSWSIRYLGRDSVRDTCAELH